MSRVIQSVTITVSEGDKLATHTVTRENGWPGSELPPIADLIQQAADSVIRDIRIAEAGQKWDEAGL